MPSPNLLPQAADKPPVEGFSYYRDGDAHIWINTEAAREGNAGYQLRGDERHVSGPDIRSTSAPDVAVDQPSSRTPYDNPPQSISPQTILSAPHKTVSSAPSTQTESIQQIPPMYNPADQELNLRNAFRNRAHQIAAMYKLSGHERDTLLEQTKAHYEDIVGTQPSHRW